MWVRSFGQKDPLEEGMATHSSVLAWRIPWTEEPGIGSQSRTVLKRPNTHPIYASWASQVVLMVKNSPTNAVHIRDVGSILWSGRSPGGGHSNPLQYSCLENPMDRGAWRATVHGVTKRQPCLK